MKRILYVIIFIFSLFIINNLLRSIYNLWQKNDLISDAVSQLNKEKREYEKLSDQLDRVKKIDFVEEEARNKLFLVKPGERMVILGDVKKEGNRTGSESKQYSFHPWGEWIQFLFGK
ncbi:MAG: septum formation initiator family protein [Candidatus Levybacteria bacterium]|nr:septum formation initiator family protein [Candidatus Levybacteria bacterium]